MGKSKKKSVETTPDTRPVVLTGATGFIGRRLLGRLLERGHHVRAVSRRAPSATGLEPHPNLEIVQADVLDASDLPQVLEGARAAFYFVHSMEGGIGDDVNAFVEKDRLAANNFGRAARDAGVEQILYLSGLKPQEEVSAHLSSRYEVELCLANWDVPVTVLRAGFIIGPQSAGFRMLQGVISRLSTMMINPDMHHQTQPVFVDDVIDALLLSLEHPSEVESQTFDLGSRETASYFDMIRSFCKHQNVEVNFVEVPWVPQTLASVYLSAVSDLPYALISSLSKGLSADLYAENEAIYDIFPQLPRTSPDDALRLSIDEARA